MLLLLLYVIIILLTFGGPAKNCNLLAQPWVQWTQGRFSGSMLARDEIPTTLVRKFFCRTHAIRVCA